MFNTMQELAAQIKGWEYGIAIVFLILFVTFWQVAGRERGTARHRQQPSTLLQYAGNGNGRRSPGRDAVTRTRPCWESKECAPDIRDNCSAHRFNALPCWIARPLAEGSTPEGCVTCPIRVEGMEHLVTVFGGGSEAADTSKCSASHDAVG